MRVAAFLACLFAAAVPAAAETGYEDVAPILEARCVMCHQGPAAPLALRLDTLDALLAGSQNGPVVIPGDPESSELLKRLCGSSLPRMPMTGPPFLSDDEIGLFAKWIAAGLAAGGAGEKTAQPAAAPTGPPGMVTYAQVAVIFATRCAKCHTESGLMGPAPEGYRLNSYANTVSAADRARIVPGNPAASELLRRVRGQAKPRMPFDGPPWLSEIEIGLIEEWIADGARDSGGNPAPAVAGKDLRLHGTLDDAGRLDGLALLVTDRTRMDGRPRAGDYVRVRGSIDASGNVLVDRIQQR